MAVAEVGTAPEIPCMEVLKEKLKNRENEVTFVRNIILDAEALKQCETAGNVMLVAEIGKTKKAEIEKTIADMSLLHRNVLGMVIIVDI